MALKTITVNSIEYTLFPWQPNASDGFKLDIAYRTAISQNTRYHEQRRSLNDLPTRSIDGTFLHDGQDAQTFVNDIRGTLQKYIVIPLYNEPLTLSAPLTTVNLDTNEDNSEYWHLRNWNTHLFGMDELTGVYEVNEIDNFQSATRIQTTGLWTESFGEDTSYFYPALFARIESKPDLEQLTAGVTQIKLVLKEVFLDGG
jgi:hypothetical protein